MPPSGTLLILGGTIRWVSVSLCNLVRRLTIHSSRSRFAARLNSGVRLTTQSPHPNEIIMFSGYTKSNLFARIAFFFFYGWLLVFLWNKTSMTLQFRPEASLGLIILTAMTAFLSIKNVYGIVVLYRHIYRSNKSA
jgi:hypothetical protein